MLGPGQEGVPPAAFASLGLELRHDRRATPPISGDLGPGLLVEGLLGGIDDLIKKSLHVFPPMLDRPTQGERRHERPRNPRLRGLHVGGGGEI